MLASNEDKASATTATAPKQNWEPFKLIVLGRVNDLVQTSTGGGKVTAVLGDSGEPNYKPSGHPG